MILTLAFLARSRENIPGISCAEHQEKSDLNDWNGSNVWNEPIPKLP